MKISKEHIIAIVVLVVILGLLGSVYQFYYKERLDEYRRNLDQLTTLEKKLDSLKDQFRGYQPQVLLDALKPQVQHLAEEVLRRSSFFNTADFLEIDPIPQGRMLRFYYETEFNKMFTELRDEVYKRNPYWQYPVYSTFGVPAPSELAGYSPTAKEVTEWLKTYHFGCSMVRMMMKAKAQAVGDIELWPIRRAAEYSGLLDMRTTGITCTMTLADVVAFLDSLRMENRYFSVDGISLQNPYLRWPQEPILEVQLLLTQAQFVEPTGEPTDKPEAPAPGAFAAPGMPRTPADFFSGQGFGLGRGGPTGRFQQLGPPPTKFQQWWRWFRKNFLPF